MDKWSCTIKKNYIMNMRLLTRDDLSSPLRATDFAVSLSASCPMKKRLLKKEVEIWKQILA